MRTRNSRLTEELINEIYENISLGLSNIDTCNILNISEETFYTWIAKGKKDRENKRNSLFTMLNEVLKKAESDFKAFHINQIRKGSDRQWQASAWLLERKHNNEFGKPENRENNNQVQQDTTNKILKALKDRADE